MDKLANDVSKEPVVNRRVFIGVVKETGRTNLIEYTNGIIILEQQPTEADHPPGMLESWLIIQDQLDKGNPIASKMTNVDFETQYQVYLNNHPEFVLHTTPLEAVFEQRRRKEIFDIKSAKPDV